MMPKKFLNSIQYILILFSILIITNLSSSYSDSQYINQTYIDTTIQRAYFILNSATDVSGMGIKIEDAINSAKKIAQHLKKMAEGNPNKKYILWKVSELESQIYLEESGLLLEKKQEQQKQINKLISNFNSELGKNRPDFNILISIYNQMLLYDLSKAKEISTSIEDRRKNIVKLVMSYLENAITQGNFDNAWTELTYIKSNLEHLKISLTEYSRYAAKLQAKIKVDNERELLNVSINDIESSLDKMLFDNVRNALVVLENRINSLQDLMPKTEWDRYYFKAKYLKNALESKEDSLVKVNNNILSQEGIIAANEFLDNVLRKYGVSKEKVAKMEFSIMQKALKNSKLQDTTVSRILESISDSYLSQDSSIISDLALLAKNKAKEKENLKAQQESQRLTHVEEIRLANISKSAELKKKREEEFRNLNIQKANKIIIDIYALIEKKEIQKAIQEYQDNQTFLARYIPAIEFSALDSCINACANKKDKKRY